VKNDAHRQFQPGGLAARLAERMRQAGTPTPRLLERATPLQARYIDDRAALLSYLAGRRHGKTDAVAARIITHSKPGTMTAYVAPTITRANEILLPLLRQLRRDCGVAWEQRGDVISFAKGGQLRLMGMSNTAEIQKLRGEDLLAAYFDECGVPKNELLKEAVLSCAWEALRRYRGEPGAGVSMSGTPGPLPEGFWWEVSTQLTPAGAPAYGASRYHGTIHDNPLFANGKAEASIQADLDAGIYVSREDSRFRREVLAQWCLPSELRCYAAYDGAVLPQALAPTFGRTVMALDFGWHDATAIIVMRLVPYEETYPQPDGATLVLRGERVHVLHATKKAHWQLPDLAARVRELQNQYRVGTIVGDSAGGSKQVVESFASMFGVAMLPADKSGFGAKRARIHTINDLFAVGHIYLYEEAACLADELKALVWNEDRDDHDERQDDHAADAMGYGIIEHYQPASESRIASAAEAEAEARAARKRAALRR
jgi:hypothetical protein